MYYVNNYKLNSATEIDTRLIDYSQCWRTLMDINLFVNQFDKFIEARQSDS